MQETSRTLLEEYEAWAVVGCSPNPRRDSHPIAGLLRARGKRVIPINPHADEVYRERAYPSLHDLPEGTDRCPAIEWRRLDASGTM